jgi:murein DD-endopeptidase MepM/ murein hydrolase activator NlpD
LRSRRFSFGHRSRFALTGIRRVILAAGVVCALGAVTAFGVAPSTVMQLPDFRYVVEPLTPAAHSAHPAETSSEPTLFRQVERVARGDTLSGLLTRLGADDQELLRFAAQDSGARQLLQLTAGRTVLADIDEVGLVHRLQYRVGQLDPEARTPPSRLVLTRSGASFTVSTEPVALERTTVMRTARIRTSLFAATDSADIPDPVAIKLVDVLDGVVNLRRDLRRGDSLGVIFEMVREADSLDTPVPGRLLAFELVNDGSPHRAIWFEHEPGKGSYYDAEGRSLTRSFLREPLEFTRISSSYSFARRHPLFRDVRAHTGVDFAAPIGTRVRSAADGVIEFIGDDGGYGKVIRVAHPGRITTVYAHLNHFGDGLKRGSRVTQGQVIGAVGMTGWTTGPHLHYEFRVDGKHTDPMTVTLPEGRRLSAAERMRYDPLAALMLEQLAQIDSIGMARFE